MHFRIHRSSNEAGGSCIEIWNDKARIVIATGLTPLNDEDFRSREELIQKGILPDIPSLYDEGGNTVLFINHSNKDHYRLLKEPLIKPQNMQQWVHENTTNIQ